MRAARGFTLVELTTVLVLVGILSAFAMARMTPASAFAPNDAARAFVAAVRLGQRVAMARTDGETQLALRRTSDALQIDLRFVDGAGESLLSSVTVDHDRLAVRVDAGALARDLAVNEPLVFRFSGDGNLVTVTAGGAPGDVAGGVGVRLTGDAALDLCIHASGYVHRGGCA